MMEHSYIRADAIEFGLYLIALVAGLYALSSRARSLGRRALRAATVIGAIGLASAVVTTLMRARSSDPIADAVPRRLEGEGFVSSDTCRACHPGEYASWHASFHRRMTQVATPDAVQARFEGTVTQRGRSYALSREGDAFFVDQIDPLWEMNRSLSASPPPLSDGPRLREPVVMTTGSHHLQAYWVRRPDSNGVYYQLPVIWDVARSRWIPSQDSFLAPPSAELTGFQTWNQQCTPCHTVAGAPRMLKDEESGRGTMFSETAELGIACEACHGPAEAHIAANRWPQRRYARHLSDDHDPTIVNPARLPPQRSAEVCGQCHSFSVENDRSHWLAQGTAFRAGGVLADAKTVFGLDHDPADPLLRRQLKAEPDALDGRFWGDGTIRVAGREYNGLLVSPCFTKGGMTCLSCHSMHDYADPSDQLHKRSDDEACFSCHTEYRANVAQHTHHPVDSVGSSCVNCHMPHTTYGLFTAMRSHHIDRPSAAVSASTGRPNACNLCHTDRTLAWTARYLSEWYAQPAVELDADQQSIAASLLWALRGDAAQRAIAAWSLGWDSAHAASGAGWQVPFLAQLLSDPYAAVRQVAIDALHALPGYAEVPYDFVGTPASWQTSLQQVLAVWQHQRAHIDTRDGRVLTGANGLIDKSTVDRLIAQRDDRPLRIVE